MANNKNTTDPRSYYSRNAGSRYVQSYYQNFGNKSSSPLSGGSIGNGFGAPYSVSGYADYLNQQRNRVQAQREAQQRAAERANQSKVKTAKQTADEINKSKNPGNITKSTGKKTTVTSSTLEVNTGNDDIKLDDFKVEDLDPSTNSSNSKDFYHQVNIFSSTEFTKGIFNERYRYGVLNPYQNITTSREILFFTKPELNIFNNTADITEQEDFDASTGLNLNLLNQAFFVDLYKRYPDVLYALQASADPDGNPFNNLLANMVQSNLDVPATTADMIETPANVYGVSYKYRGSSEAGDDNHTFSLEFKDTRFLPVYNFFKAYDQYEILKHHGVIKPKKHYIMNKILHDQYSIYKFILDEDMETIIFYAKYYGVKSLNLPRDVFNSTTYDNGLSYSIDFDAAFVEDMNPHILYDFNTLSYPYFSKLKYDIPVFNTVRGIPDMRAAKGAIVVQEQSGMTYSSIVGIKDTEGNTQRMKFSKNPSLLNHVPGGKVYKLRWKGDQTI